MIRYYSIIWLVDTQLAQLQHNYIPQLPEIHPSMVSVLVAVGNILQVNTFCDVFCENVKLIKAIQN